MAGSDSSVVLPRLKREDYERTKHDSAFSPWKVLVGPTDWEDYSSGKEGATRYRVHNLPTSPGPGIYELGVAASRAKSGREIAKLDPRLVVVVYLGQADCVRTRLQQYGRSGAHLGRCSPVACEIQTSFTTRQLGLFEQVLSRGNPIVFRWAPMNNKGDAQRAEHWLLGKFDYAWNKGSNVSRRPCDIFRKLDEIRSSTYHIPRMAMKLLPFRPRQVGITIKGKLLSEKKESFPQTGGESSNFFDRIFKFSTSRPRLVISESRANETAISGTSPAKESFSPLCGVILEDGFRCTKPPVQGRKRCSGHEGMRIRASNSVSYANDTAISGCYPANESFSPLCGVISEDGFPCTKPPVQGRTRCSGHKGMRIGASNSVSYANDTAISGSYPANESFSPLCGVISEDGFPCTKPPVQRRTRCSEHKGMRIGASNSVSYANDTAISGSYPANESFSPLCGVISEDGFPCTKPPVQGRTRCSGHKGMRIGASNSVSYANDTAISGSYPANESFSPLCGVISEDGFPCTKPPVQGRQRCSGHKGMRIGASNSVSYANDTAISGSYRANESFSPLCGVISEDGFPCTKPPVQGRQRCSEHKGMRIRPSNSVPRRKGASSEIHELGNRLEAFSRQWDVKNDFGAVCGVNFGDGTFCMRRAARGRVRCERHKGMRVN